MYGKNPVEKQELRDDGSLHIHKIFYTFQGEGPYSGHPAVFVRLAGCNLRCFWCDTDFHVHTLMTLDEICSEIYKQAAFGQLGAAALKTLSPDHDLWQQRPMVVLTGGEPLRQNVTPLIARLVIDNDMHVQIETAGTLWVDGLDEIPEHVQDDGRGLSIVCSPKTKQINPKLARLVTAYKYVIREDEVDRYDGLPNRSTQMNYQVERLYRPTDARVPIYVSPCDEGLREINDRNLNAARTVALAFGYRLTYQLHKLAGVE